MSLSDDELDMLRHGLRFLQARKDVAASVFYDHLFRIAPETRPLFTEDIFVQTEKVMFAFGAVVGQIHDLDACRDMTRDLALRHVDYGVYPAHYALVGQAVMATLADVLEEDFTPEMEAAWQSAYDTIAGAMIRSAYDPGSAHTATAAV